MESLKIAESLPQPEIQDLQLKFLRLCDNVRSLLKQNGITSFPSTRRKTLERLAALDSTKLESLIRQLKICITIYADAAHASQGDYDEKVALQRALKFYGISLDKESFDTVAPDDIIEIYDADSNQLYRSLNFFKTTGYSLEDLLVNEWYFLWERPTWVQESLMKTMMGLIRGEMLRAAFNVPEHLIREIYQNEESPQGSRLILTDMHMCLPYRDDDGAIKGIVCTSQCKVLDNVDKGQAPGVSFL